MKKYKKPDTFIFMATQLGDIITMSYNGYSLSENEHLGSIGLDDDVTAWKG